MSGAAAPNPLDVNSPGVASKPQCAMADEAGAKQGRQAFNRAIFVKRKTIFRVGNAQFGVAAIKSVTSKRRTITEILAVHAAKIANAACPPEPRHTDPHPGWKTCYTISNADDAAHDFVHRNRRQLCLGQFTVDYMEIGSAYTKGFDCD